MIGRRFSGLATLLALLAVSAPQLPASSSWKVGSLYVEERSEYQGARIVRNTIVDKRGRVELIEIPVYDRRGRWVKDRLLCPDGSPWLYSFPVYGAAALGGIGRVQPDIESILKVLPAPVGKERILRIAFLSAGRVHVRVGWSGPGLQGHGYDYEFRKVFGKWKRIPKVSEWFV